MNRRTDKSKLCPECGAAPGVRCRSANDLPLSTSHAARLDYDYAIPHGPARSYRTNQVLANRCDDCGAVPGSWCRQRSNRRSWHKQHPARLRLVSNLVLAGLTEEQIVTWQAAYRRTTVTASTEFYPPPPRRDRRRRDPVGGYFYTPLDVTLEEAS